MHKKYDTKYIYDDKKFYDRFTFYLFSLWTTYRS